MGGNWSLSGSRWGKRKYKQGTLFLKTQLRKQTKKIKRILLLLLVLVTVQSVLVHSVRSMSEKNEQLHNPISGPIACFNIQYFPLGFKVHTWLTLEKMKEFMRIRYIPIQDTFSSKNKGKVSIPK